LTLTERVPILAKLLRQPLYGWINFPTVIGVRLKSKLYYRFLFGDFGSSSLLFRPTFLLNPRYIHIGKNVRIAPGVRLEAVVLDPRRPPELRIGDNVNIEQNVHIVCHNRIVIGSDVSITGFCSIMDTTHPIDGIGPDTKMGNMINDDDAVVEIGRGTFIGMGARILPNVHIGTGAVIGTNSVVTRDVPDFSIASGIPARVQRQRRML